MDEYRLGLYEKAMPDGLSWKEKLAFAGEAGYDYVEMSIDESDRKLKRLELSDIEIMQIHNAMRETGIRIESICLSAQRKYPLGTGLPGAEQNAIKVLSDAIVLASKLGVRIIQIQGYDCYYNEESNTYTKERFYRNLKIGTNMAAKYGVILGIETMENSFMDTTEKAMYYVNEINSPYLTVYPDIGNISNATQYVCKDLRCGKGHISAAHLKETIPGKFRGIPFGTGQVDFPSAIRTLLNQGVRRFTAEFWHDTASDWMLILKHNNEFLKEQFKLSETY